MANRSRNFNGSVNSSSRRNTRTIKKSLTNKRLEIQGACWSTLLELL